MRQVLKSRTQATTERLGGCGYPNCDKPAVCANCVQCPEHHDDTTLRGLCGFIDPVPVKFDAPDPRAEVQMLVLDDNDVRLRNNNA